MRTTSLQIRLAAVLLLVATQSFAQTALADTAAFPALVYHRMGWEAAAALPGKVIYTPFFVLFYGGGQLATAVWEQRVIDRAKALLTTADGRAGVRPLSNTNLGSGVRLFYKDMVGADAVLRSTLGRSGAKRQHHLLALSWRGGWGLEGQFRKQAKESFYGIGNG